MLEIVTNGIERYWLADHSAVVYMIHLIDDDRAVDLSESILHTLYEWPTDTPFKVIFNTAMAGASMNYMLATSDHVYDVGVTQDGRNAVYAYLNDHPDLYIYLALTVSKAISGHKLYINSGQTTGHPQIAGGMFFDMEHAVEWLREQG